MALYKSPYFTFYLYKGLKQKLLPFLGPLVQCPDVFSRGSAGADGVADQCGGGNWSRAVWYWPDVNVVFVRVEIQSSRLVVVRPFIDRLLVPVAVSEPRCCCLHRVQTSMSQVRRRFQRQQRRRRRRRHRTLAPYAALTLFRRQLPLL